MKEHRDTSQRLSIELDDNAQNFTVYTDRLEKKLNKARIVMKLTEDNKKNWTYDLDGVMIELYWDKVVCDGVLIRLTDGEDEELLREVAEKIIKGESSMEQFWLVIGLILFFGGFLFSAFLPESIPYIIMLMVISIAVYIAHMKIKKQPVSWEALATIGTVVGVGWAIFSGDLVDKINPPKLDMEFYELDISKKNLTERMASHFIGITEGKPQYNDYIGYLIDLNILNKGKTTAKDTNVVITAVWSKKDNAYVQDKSWKRIIPSLSEPIDKSFPLDIHANSKIPYVFSVGSFSLYKKSVLLLTYKYLNRSRGETIDPGVYCLELEVSASNAKVITRYLYVTFENFSDANVLSDVLAKIKSIELSKQHPSSRQ